MGWNTAGAADVASFVHGRVKGIGVVVLALMSLQFMSASASATTGHAGAGTFGTQFSLDPGGFAGNGPTGLAVRQSTGDVFTVDPGHTDPLGSPEPRIERFNTSGVFQSEFGIDPLLYTAPSALAIDSGGSLLYVGVTDVLSGGGVVLKYSTAGVFDSVITANVDTTFNPGAVAVNPTSGDLYVGAADPSTGLWSIQVFDNAGAPVATFDGATNAPDGTGFGTVQSIAIDGTGRVYVADTGKNRVDRYSAAGAWEATIDDGSRGAPVTVAADPVSNEIYVLTSNQTISWFSAGGAVRQETFSGGIISGSGLGVEASTGKVFVADSGQSLGLTFTEFAGPTVATTGSSSIDPTSQTLEGAIDPEGVASEYRFDYGLDTSYGASTAPISAGSGNTAASVNTTATGLLPNTRYHFRVVGTNAGGAIYGDDVTFTTGPGAPAGASSISAITASLTGVVDPHGSAATYHFEYGPDTTYGQSTPETSAGATNGEKTVTAPIAGLTPGTTYHVRLVATDSATNATTRGADGTFTTDPAPGATTGAVTGVEAERATFNGTVNTHGRAGSYRFSVESSTSTYTGKTEAKDVLTGPAGRAVTGALTDLPPGQTFTVRLSVTGSGVTTLGDAVTFSTSPLPLVAPPAPPPSVNDSNGCTAPALTAYNSRPKPGDTITIAGKDLGVGGTVVLGAKTVKPTNWSTTGFSIVVPKDATGTLPLTVNCGKASNTIAIQMFKAPSNSFTAKGKVKGGTATLRVKVPGPGAISVTGGSVKKATSRAGKAETVSVKVSLSKAGKTSVRRHKKLAVSLTVRFTPTGGTTSKQTVKVTFKR